MLGNDFGRRVWLACMSLALVLLLGQAGTVSATTPDGVTPANEHVCDILQGGTPGLYGLCVAYCEAQDMDPVAEPNPPNNRILDNYNRKRQATDPEMPCVRSPCNCWSLEEIGQVGESNPSAVGCLVGTRTAQIAFVDGNAAITQSATATRDRSGNPLCSYYNSVTGTNNVQQPTTEASWQACFDQVANRCASAP